MLLRISLLFSALLLVSGCTTPVTTMEPSAKPVHLRLDSAFDADSCQWLGEVTGSEGHWYSYLFFPNDVLIRGAMNDIKNQASFLGGNTVYMTNPQDFVTSFTVMGNAYKCP